MFKQYAKVTTVLVAALVIGACSSEDSGSGSGGTNVIPPVEVEIPDTGSVGSGILPSLPLSDKQFENVHFSGSETCGTCHNEQSPDAPTMVDSTGKDLSIGTAWESSLMANAARDPYWHAVVASELDLYPSASEKINDTCTRCHAPMANEVGRRIGEPLQVFDTGSEANGDFKPGVLSLGIEDEQFNHAMDGVSCSVCHQMADDGNLGTDAGMTGGFFIEQYSEENIAERPAYGQYTDVDVGYMKNQARFTPQFGAHISTSESCGACHNLKSGPLDTTGQPVHGNGDFAEQMTYSEWLASDFNVGGSKEQSCQDCHMPKIQEAVPIAGAGAGGAVHDNFAEHTFLGANTVMLEMMKNYRTELGLDEGIDFDSAIVRNREFLRTSAELEVTKNEVADDLMTIDVKVQNLTGHKLPSGYHSRRVYLHVLVTDREGQQIYENGRRDERGKIIGVSEDLDPGTWEPHYDVITDASQVQVYQSIMANSDDERTHSLLNGTRYYKDNRLTPIGFDKKDATQDVAVEGAALTDGDFNGGKDIVTYRIGGNGNGPYNVLVELVYQPLSYGHLLDLFERSDDVERIDMFRTMYDNSTLHAEVIDSLQFTTP